MSKAPPRYHRFRWRWFWAVFTPVLAAYAGLGIWMHYQVQRWNVRARSLNLAAQSVRYADPPTVIARIGQPTSSTQNGSELVLSYGPPDYPLGLKFRFVNGRPATENRAALARWYAHPVAGALDRFGEIPLAISLPLWLALGIGACFHHRYARPVSHLLLATAFVVLLSGVSIKPLNPGPWTLGAVAVAVGAFAIWFSYRSPKDDTTPACDECGYNLTGNVSGICPECGTPVPAETRTALTGDTCRNEARGKR